MSSCKLLFIMMQKQGQSLWTNQLNRKAGLSNSVETLIYSLNLHGIDATVEHVTDRNEINSVVSRIKPDVVIIEAYFVTPGKFQALKLLHPKIHWIVRNHSEIPFLAQEGNAGTWNCEYLKMGVEISHVSSRTVEDMMGIAENLDADPCLLSHLPNVYLNTQDDDAVVKPAPQDEIHIGCFGAVRELKNHWIQSLAAISYATKAKKKLFFHINATRVEGNGSQPLKNLRGTFQRVFNAELVEHHWMSKEQFYHLMKSQIDVVMQCSLTESFNIVAADAVYCKVPVIASPEVRWLSPRFHCDPCSGVAITKHLSHLFANEGARLHGYIDKQISDLESYNDHSVKIWLSRFG